MIGKKNSTNKIDEVAFKVWAETGSLDGARQYFQKHKILHDNGRQYSVAGIRFCAMRHMVRNYDDAVAFIVSEYEKRGIIPNMESIEVTMIGYAVEILRYRTDVMEWAEKHDLLERYQSFIDERTKKSPMESRRRIFAKTV